MTRMHWQQRSVVLARATFCRRPMVIFHWKHIRSLIFPLYNFVPWMWLRRFVCRMFRANFEYVNDVRYLPESRLKLFFPEATIAYEKVLGLKKSFYVYHLNENIR